jgi:hypothetical protein
MRGNFTESAGALRFDEKHKRLFNESLAVRRGGANSLSAKIPIADGFYFNFPSLGGILVKINLFWAAMQYNAIKRIFFGIKIIIFLMGETF